MNDAGQCTIMCRLSLQGKRAEISTSEYAKAPANDKAKPGEWDSETQSIKGGTEKARITNNRLSEMRVKLDKIYNRLVETGQEATPERMKAEYQGANDGTQIGLLKAFKIHNEKLMVSAGTLKNYRTRIQNVTAFVNHIYRKEDILLTDVKKGFADDLVHYLLEKGFSVDHAANHIKALTKVFEMAVN